MSSLTVILPIHKFDDEVKTLLPNAITSVENMDYDLDMIIVGPEEVTNSIKDIVKTDVPVVYLTSEKTDYCSMVNLAAKEVKAPYMTVLEFDDQFAPKWLDNVSSYMEGGYEASAYLPLTSMLDIQKNEKQFVGFLNEIAWARSFSDTLGYITYDSLFQYYNYNMSGAVIKTSVFNSVGGLKPSIKLFFWYEFMLRLTNKGNKIFVVPKLGYKHYVNRPDSITSEYNKTLSPEEAEFWLSTSKQECFFEYDRNKTYNPEED